MNFYIIAAVEKKNGLGKDGGLVWQLKGDMKHFKEVTTETVNSKQNVVIMGSTTWASLPERFRPLPGRLNVVLSRRHDYSVPEGVILASSLNEALDTLTSLGQGVDKVFVIGGALVYNEAINHPLCQKIYLTEIDKEFDCDVFFPIVNKNIFAKINSSETQEEDGIKYKFVEYEKKNQR